LALAIGIDVGTSGVRVVAADPEGNTQAAANRHFRKELARSHSGHHEQQPCEWWTALCEATQEVCRNLRWSSKDCRGVAVTSTSGSLVVIDEKGNPLRPAILYDDQRAGRVAEALNRSQREDETQWTAAHSLSKAVWVRETEPQIWEQTRRLLHPADWLAGKLSGDFCWSDYTNALKLGYEPSSGTWAPTVRKEDVSHLLPQVARPGQTIGKVRAAAAKVSGLPPGIPVIAGATDGIASLIASGARRPGDANTTLGTTIVWKALCEDKPRLQRGIYCHLHPSGLWAPGAASNTGPGSIRRNNPSKTPQEMDELAEPHLPSRIICYPLSGRGERFPFSTPNAEAFGLGDSESPAAWHAAQLQALGFVERWGYEILAQCGVERGVYVYSAGSASRSRVFCQLRADILGQVVTRAACPEAAFGAAILAATGVFFQGDVTEAIGAMSRIEQSYEPNVTMAAHTDALYYAFREVCSQRGYVS
jgi:sugar (pentulose or hexulose) kinase